MKRLNGSSSLKSKIFMTIVSATMLSSVSAWADSPTTALEKTNVAETVLYGRAQEGALTERVEQIEDTVYGKRTGGNLTDKADLMYRTVADADGTVSIRQETDFLEWNYQNSVTDESVLDKLDRLERALNGRITTAPVRTRISALKKTLHGADVKTEVREGTIDATTVFGVKLNEAITSKTNAVGDTFTFTLTENLTDGDILLVPAGTVGTGHISELRKAGAFGRSGKLELTFDEIRSIDGTTFAAEQGEEAKEKTKSQMTAAGASVAGAALLGPVGLVGGFFIKGKNVELPADTLIYIQPVTTVTVNGLVSGDAEAPVRASVETTDSGASIIVYDADAVTSDNGASVVLTEEEAVHVHDHEDEVLPDETVIHEDESVEESLPEEAVVVVRRSRAE